MTDKYAVFDKSGVLSSLLIDGVHSIPKGAVIVQEEQWSEIHQNPNCVWKRSANGVITRTDPVTDYRQAIAEARFRHEVSGITVNGIEFDTSRESQYLITGAAFSASRSPDYFCNWKTASGFVRLDAEALLSVADAVRGYVQACFDREVDLLASLDDGTYTDAMLGEGWPNKI